MSSLTSPSSFTDDSNTLASLVDCILRLIQCVCDTRYVDEPFVICYDLLLISYHSTIVCPSFVPNARHFCLHYLQLRAKQIFRAEDSGKQNPVEKALVKIAKKSKQITLGVVVEVCVCSSLPIALADHHHCNITKMNDVTSGTSCVPYPLFNTNILLKLVPLSDIIKLGLTLSTGARLQTSGQESSYVLRNIPLVLHLL